MGIRIVKNYPSPRLLDVIGATKQSVQEAIGELVANSLDARFNDEKLDISIDLSKKRIIVIDNGKGMTSEILEKAVCIAEDMSKHIERGDGAKGYFGMGFKTSCSTLGYFYEIYTRPFNENVEYHVAFDIKDFSNRTAGSDAWDIAIEDGEPMPTSPLGNTPHGTAFVISKLRKKDFPLSAVLDYMGDAFKGHIEAGDKITVIDENGRYQALPKTYDFLPGTKVIIDEKFGIEDKYHITGWVAIDKQTHNDTHYGFNIYRKGQLVKTYDKSWFRPHLMTSRIIGEVNMDFLDATFYKQGVQHSEDWDNVAIHMKDFLKGVAAASSNLSKKGNINNPVEKKKIVSQLRNEYNIIDSVDTTDGESNDQQSVEAKPSNTINNTIKNVIKENSLSLENGSIINITFVEKEEDGHNVGPYDYIFDPIEEPQELQVLVFKNHPLWLKKSTDSEVREILAISDAIYRALVVELGVESRKALIVRNEWVSQRIEIMK